MSSACPGKVFCAPVIGLAGTAGGGRCDPFRDPFCGGWGGGDFSGGGGGEPRAPRRSARDTGSKRQNETNRMRLQDSLGCRQNMNSFVATLAMLFRSEDLLTDLDLLVIAIATALWIWGILEARRRRVSPKLQLLFTLIMLGGASGDILTRLIVSSRTNLAYLIGSSLLLAALALGAFWLLRKKFVLAYIFFAFGISLVFVSFVFETRLGEQLFYPVLILGLLLFLSSVFLARRGRKKEGEMEKT